MIYRILKFLIVDVSNDDIQKEIQKRLPECVVKIYIEYN